ncbi:MAG TPA: hypothetical protein VFT12_09465 [Thermoanaerobaculia bacterium]|nr:hypothetical protein [Thermoanaerobaculia bacterium]
MKKSFALVVPLGLALAGACGGGEDELRRDQQNYEVVQEGAGGAVTSTIHAPGEVMPPLTGTNADTTTGFTLPTAIPGDTQAPPPGSLAGTLPSDPYPTATRRPTPSPAPVPTPTPPPASSYEPQPPEPQPTQTQPQPQPQPPPPPPTTTTQTPDPEPEPEEEPDAPPPQPETPPPPPSTTDTGTP